jgi:prolyl-tRNA editing enzyme YbaK/EbsC (Cys-tRNA(Pro) deacylase)
VTLGTLTWVRALDRPDLLAGPTLVALESWVAVDPAVADAVLVTEIDPDLADTAALTEAFALPASASANCVLVAGRREGEERVAAAVVRATTRADVNATVKRLLDVRKASFLPMDRAVEESGMEYGGITPLGLPARYRVLVDGRVAVDDPDAGGTVIIGSGIRRSKLALPGALLARAPGVELVDGLALA